jgi:hypothetical protein
VKTIPTVSLVEKAETVLLPDLPDEVALAMRDIAGAARKGLLALSVAAGMAVMQAMFEVEITEACGPKGKHSRRQTPLPEGPDEHRAHVPNPTIAKSPMPRRWQNLWSRNTGQVAGRLSRDSSGLCVL